MLDLQKGARSQDQFHLQVGPPKSKVWGWKYLVRRVSWDNVVNADGGKGWFVSWQVGYYLRWYWGTAKCDGTRTYMYWDGVLGEPVDPNQYVMNTWAQELWSVRRRSIEVNPIYWYSMGSI